VLVDVTDWAPFPIAHLNHVIGILYGMAFGSAFLLISGGSRWQWAVSLLPFVLFTSVLYSPWLVEWQLVKQPLSLVTTKANCQLKSIEPVAYTPAHITVVNSSDKHIALYWLNYEGNPDYYFRLAPGDTDEYDLFIGHHWCVVDVESKESLQAFTVTEENQIITVR